METREASWQKGGALRGGKREGVHETESIEGVLENHRRCRASAISAPRRKSSPNPKLISSAPLSRGPTGESRGVVKEVRKQIRSANVAVNS